MADQFDPYYTWFGIPPEEQPADHYRLLGVRPFEANDEVIVNASDQRMAYLRTFQVGKRAKESQRLLNEVAAAQSVLLDPKKKKDYDEQLRRKAAAKRAAVAAPAAVLPTAKPLQDSQPLQPVVLQPVIIQPAVAASVIEQPPLKAKPVAQPLDIGITTKPSAQAFGAAAARRSGPPMALALAIGGGSAVLGLLVLLATLAWAATRPAPRPLTTNNPPVQPPEAAPEPKDKNGPPAPAPKAKAGQEETPAEKVAPPSTQPATRLATSSAPPAASSPATAPSASTPPTSEEALGPNVVIHERRFGNPVQYRLVLSPDGTRYFGVDAKAKVCIAHYVGEQPSHGMNSMSAVVFSPDGQRTAMWGTTNTIYVEKASEQPPRRVACPLPGAVRCAAFTGDGEWVVAGIDAPQKLVVCRANGDGATWPDFSTSLPNVSWIGVQGDRVCCWSPTRKAEILSLNNPTQRTPVADELPQPPIGLTQLGWLALVRVNETVALHYWRPETGKKWAEFQVSGLADPADFLTTSSAGNLVAVRQDTALAIVQVPGNKAVTRIGWRDGRFRFAAFTADGAKLAVNAPADYLWLLDVKQLLAKPAWRVPTRDERAELGLRAVGG